MKKRLLYCKKTFKNPRGQGHSETPNGEGIQLFDAREMKHPGIHFSLKGYSVLGYWQMQFLRGEKIEEFHQLILIWFKIQHSTQHKHRLKTNRIFTASPNVKGKLQKKSLRLSKMREKSLGTVWRNITNKSPRLKVCRLRFAAAVVDLISKLSGMDSNPSPVNSTILSA